MTRSFSVILSTDRQTDTGENIIILAKVKSKSNPDDERRPDDRLNNHRF